MVDLSVRSPQIEIMDDLNCSGEVVNQTLRELETINTLLGGNHVTINGIKQLLKNRISTKPLVIGDLGCGGGDILKLIDQWSKRKNISLSLIGIDANPNIIDFAKKNSVDFPNIQYEAVDIFSDAFRKKEFDIVIGTLFFHHFDKTQLVEFFRQVKTQVRVGVVINDIHRHWFAFHSIRLLTKIFSRSAMVKFDAPLSVLRAFKKNELVEILEMAGIKNFTLRWMWAFRWQVIVKADN
jgi:2-polyprenyl-3-methyl-5-hydroxy-6-metoxy-1,4-benzoquinol methylase